MLSLTRADKIAIGEVLTFANKNKIDKATTAKIFDGLAKPVGDTAGYCVKIRAGKRHYRVVFCYEEQPIIGWMRHLSLSSLDEKSIALSDVNELLRVFGFRWRTLPSLTGDSTSYGAARTYWEGDVAFNVMEIIDDETAKKAEEQGGLSSIERLGKRVVVINPAQPIG